MAKTWFSPEAKAIKSFAEGLLLDRRGMESLPFFKPTNWVLPNVGGGVTHAQGTVELLAVDGLYLLTVKAEKFGRTWVIVSFEISNSKGETIMSQSSLFRLIVSIIGQIRQSDEDALAKQETVRDILLAKGIVVEGNLVEWLRGSSLLQDSYGYLNLEYPGERWLYNGKQCKTVRMAELEPSEISLPEYGGHDVQKLIASVVDPELRRMILNRASGEDPSSYGKRFEIIVTLFRALSLNFSRAEALGKIVTKISRTILYPPETADQENAQRRDMVFRLLDAWLPQLPAPRESGKWVYHNDKPAEISYSLIGYGEDINEFGESPDAIGTYSVSYRFEDGTTETKKWVAMFGMPDQVMGIIVTRHS